VGQVVDQPEAAQQEGALLALEPVGGLVGQVAVEEPVAGPEPLGDGAVVATMRGWSASMTRRSGRARRLASRAPPSPRCSVIAAAPRPTRPRGSARRIAFGSARHAAASPVARAARRAGPPVEGHLAHGRRVGEHPTRGADLPDAVVRGAHRSPPLRRAPQGAARRLRASPALGCPLVGAVDDLTVGVVLALVGGGVAPPHRLPAPVALEVVLPLRLGLPAVEV
jgi:hypothetical protein